MNVVHVTTVHPRDDIRVVEKECTTLARAGYDVSLVVADGQGGAFAGGIRVFDIGLRHRSRILRALVTGLRAMLFAARLRPKAIHIHDPELLLSTWIAAIYGVPVIYDIHEDTRTQIALKSYIPRFLRRIASRAFGLFEDFLARRMTALIVPQEEMQQRYSKLNRCINLPNFVDLDYFPERSHAFDRPIVFHAGALSIQRGLLNLVRASENLGSQGDMYVAGSLPSGFSDSDLGRIGYLGRLRYDEVLVWYRRANIGIIPYNNVGQYYMASAVKCFEYMAASMPILLPDFGEWLGFNSRVECGINLDMTDPVAVGDALRYLADNPLEAARLGANGRAHVEAEFSWQSVSGRLIGLYQNICLENGRHVQ